MAHRPHLRRDARGPAPAGHMVRNIPNLGMVLPRTTAPTRRKLITEVSLVTLAGISSVSTRTRAETDTSAILSYQRNNDKTGTDATVVENLERSYVRGDLLGHDAAAERVPGFEQHVGRRCAGARARAVPI